MRKEFIALGGALDPETGKPVIGGSAYLFIYGNAGLLIDAGIYPQSQKLLRQMREKKRQESTKSLVEFKVIGGVRRPILPKSCLLEDSDFIPASNNAIPNFSILRGLKQIVVVLTHSHADHSGAIPYFKAMFPEAEIFMTRPTRDISMWSWNDYRKIMRQRKQPPIFGRSDIQRVHETAQIINMSDRKKVGPFELSFFPAGHILGAISVLVKADDGTSIFFTGDISFQNQHTVYGAPFLSPQTIGHIDYLITESTYGGASAPPRRETEEKMAADVESCLQSGGKFLGAVLSIGRAPEVLTILDRYGITRRWPVYVAGSAQDIMDIYIENNALDSRAKDTYLKWGDRGEIAHSPDPCVVLAPAGMVIGGQVVYFTQKWAGDPKNTIALTCYQEQHTPGFRLLNLEKGEKIRLGDETAKVDVTVNAKRVQYSLSSHATGNEIGDMIRRMKPRNGTFLIHGEEAKMDKLIASLPDQKIIKAACNHSFSL